ncbi:MAG: winged helix-turn-helix transcriptional regulator [Ignavibacteria bacterium]|nr:winged helix-turn-helix transcriptional regulator [Ignavibacteria bacterium]
MPRELANVFKALSDANRVRIVKMLGERELCLCEVREVLGLSNSTVSKHLTILRDAGLLLDSKEGRWVNFRLNKKSEERLIRSVLALVNTSFDDDPTIRNDSKKLRRVDRKVICDI